MVVTLWFEFHSNYWIFMQMKHMDGLVVKNLLPPTLLRLFFVGRDEILDGAFATTPSSSASSRGA